MTGKLFKPHHSSKLYPRKRGVFISSCLIQDYQNHVVNKRRMSLKIEKNFHKVNPYAVHFFEIGIPNVDNIKLLHTIIRQLSCIYCVLIQIWLFNYGELKTIQNIDISDLVWSNSLTVTHIIWYIYQNISYMRLSKAF